MVIKDLYLNNFRGFSGEKHLTNLSESYNVFVGINGSGKTSILDLLAMFLNQFTVKLNGINYRDVVYYLTQTDINLKESETHNKIILKDPFNHRNPFFDEPDLTIVLKKDFSGAKNEFQDLNNIIRDAQGVLKQSESFGIPIIKYYQAQRDTNEGDSNKKSNRRYLAPQLKVYDDAFKKGLNFDQFVRWFIEEENKENREKVKQKDFEIINVNLSTIKRALNLFFEEFPSSSYSNIRVAETEYDQKTSEISSLVIDKDSVTYNLNQLSLGEKSVILMVADMAHRLAIANPKEDPLKGAGIVLIDEIDLHLHPAWQRAVIPCLIKTFPNIQFFTTTHSPQVLSNLRSQNIYIIDNFEILSNTVSTYGKDSNSILWNLFGLRERPEFAQEDFRELNKLIDEEKVELIDSKIKELEDKYGSDDDDILRAKLYLSYFRGSGEAYNKE